MRGGVRGSIRAVSVKLQATAQVEGDITHQKLSIAEGAEFDGRVKLTKDASELMPVLDRRGDRALARQRRCQPLRNTGPTPETMSIEGERT